MKTPKKLFMLSFLILISYPIAFSQDDLMDMLEEEVGEQTTYTAYTFKSTRVINGHSIERMPSRQLDFRVNHRFGEVNSGLYELWGLDHALINFSLEYGITNWLMVGFRRGTYQKTYDGSLKFSILRQSTGKKVMPVSVSYYTDISANTLRVLDPNRPEKLSERLAYTHQLLIARKFNEQISIQISPSFVHRNLVNYYEENDVISVGIGGRYKFARRVAFMLEYFYSSNTAGIDMFYNPLSVGFDIETGGHVFQLFFTNSRAMVEKGFIAETRGSWLDGGVYFGFNISRVFAIGKAKQ